VIPAELIDEVGRTRLGVVVTSGEKKNGAGPGTREAKEQEKDELLRAVKTLLELHDYLQEMKTSDSNSNSKEAVPVIRRPYQI
jgi:hypothetical protein